MTPEQQADYIVRAHRFVPATYPYVTQMYWYKEMSTPGGTDVHEEGFGLLDSNLVERPVYWALKSYLVG